MHAAARLKRAVRARIEHRPARPREAADDPGVIATAGRPPGSARASSFFDAFPRFYETSETSPYAGRLNLRYEAIFGENRDVFAGARVLDVASHDGRWSLAALETGAARVVGIEPRPELVRAARENLALYSRDEGEYEFVQGDVFQVLAERSLEVDVVLCLGFLYHTLRYGELMHRIRETNARHLLLDTQVLRRRKGPVVRLRLESDERQGNVVGDVHGFRGRTLIGWPSRSALELIVESHGFAVERYSDWGSLVRDNPGAAGVEDYAAGRRVTARCVATD
ncbi:MAG TPA: class I SAM-dependent methyltransferase [Gaiellaceae bacterium]|nr:class I SAM-dependent methyltransferase [Gaiellaceae bacterium]